MSLLKDKKGLIMGVANERSIAWGISKKLSNEGADLAFTYVGESLKKRVVPLADSLGSKLTIDCNVENEQQIKDTFTKIKQKWGNIDFVVHSVAFSDKSELSGEYLSTSRNNFLNSMLISCFSFTEVARAAADLMKKGGSLLFFSSAAANIGLSNHEAIAAAKGGLEGLVRSAAATYAKNNIRVNALALGLVESNLSNHIVSNPAALEISKKMHSIGRIGSPENIAKFATPLILDSSSWITGSIINIDGGLSTTKLVS